MRKIFERSMAVITCVVLGMGLSGCGALMNVATAVNEVANSMTVETPGRRMGVQVQNVELIENGKQVMIEFLLNNRGQDIGNYWLGKATNDPMVAYDNLGTKANVRIVWGDKNTLATGMIGAGLPGNTPILIKVFVYNFNPQATHFSQIKFFGSCDYSCDGATGAYILKNVPIQK